MHRLPVSPDLLKGGIVPLPGDALKHLKVLRPNPGETVELFDGAGFARAYRCGARYDAPLEAVGEVTFTARPEIPLTLFACVTKGSRWDWTVEKATELGVARIVPVLSARCIVRLDARERVEKAKRWRRVAEDAVRQSDAVYFPEVCEPCDFKTACARARESLCFAGILSDPPPGDLLTALLCADGAAARAKGLSLFTGPEGDFSPEERDMLLTFATPTSFGDHVLRAETAAIYGLSVLASVRTRAGTARVREMVT